MTRSPRMIYQTPETRRQILDAAWTLFRTRGFFDTQMKDVAAATNMSRSSLYRYFQDKTELALALMQGVLEKRLSDDRWTNELAESASPIDRIEAYLRTTWLNGDAEDEWVFLAEFDAYYSRARVPPDFRSTLEDRIRTLAKTPMLDWIVQGQREGSIRSDIDAHLLAVTLVNAVRGLQQRLLLRGELLVEAVEGETDRMSNAHLNLLIEGLKPPRGGKS